MVLDMQKVWSAAIRHGFCPVALVKKLTVDGGGAGRNPWPRSPARRAGAATTSGGGNSRAGGACSPSRAARRRDQGRRAEKPIEASGGRGFIITG
uniref:Uncharacterized protein n=1 Tax=Oryza glumipatula TaxID=40148 RepID=A0A0E0BBK5_9ORYZ